MVNKENRLAVFAQLGKKVTSMLESEGDSELSELIIRAGNNNNWFTPAIIRLALAGVARYLAEPGLSRWADSYGSFAKPGKNVGVVMAGNIPLVGFHDALCVLIQGHSLTAKLSSKDEVLMRFVFEYICEIEPGFKAQIDLESRMNKVDAIIATGSDNTARHFKTYFGDRPHLIRGNRNGVAVLSGNETGEQLSAIGKDIFTYFGLGCRNVSKLFVPKGYDFTSFYEAIEQYSDVLHQHRYANNYDYNRSIFLINMVPHLDNRFLMVREDPSLTSPISVLHYETYADSTELAERLEAQSEGIQCIVSEMDGVDGVAFGAAQEPGLTDYADGVDTMAFLAKV